MLKDSQAFSGYSVNDLASAKHFYEGLLGLDVIEGGEYLQLQLQNGHKIFLYAKTDHVAATFTVLNFPVDDIDAVVYELGKKGIQFEIYESMAGAQDEKGILRGKAAKQGPDIAWFKDPAGNILSVLTD